MSLSSAHRYQESACQAEIWALRECCQKLKPEILKHCSHCATVVHGKTRYVQSKKKKRKTVGGRRGRGEREGRGGGGD